MGAPPQRPNFLRILLFTVLGVIALVVLLGSVDFIRDTLHPMYENLAAKVFSEQAPETPEEIVAASQRIASWQSVRKHTEFFDAEHLSGRGAGLYTYLLWPNLDTSARAKAFFEQLFLVSLLADRARPSPQFTNLIFMPTTDQRAVTSDFWGHSSTGDTFQEAAAHLVDVHYDRQLAGELLRRFCQGATPACATQGSGPFLVAVAESLTKDSAKMPPHVFFDLSAVHERAFARIVQELMASVDPADVEARAKLEALRSRVSRVEISAADWIGSAPGGGIAQFVAGQPAR